MKWKVIFCFLCLLLAITGMAQDTTGVSYPWSIIELTDYRMKPGVVWIKVPPPRGGMPIWIPISGGVIVTGGVVYLLTNTNDSSPDPTPTPLIARDDLFSVACGQSLSFDPLINDQGEGIRIISVSSTAAVSIDWQANGTVTVADLLNSGSVTLVIVIEDALGQTAEETVTIMITSSPLSATPDEFTTDFETPVTGNVLANDAGQEITVIGFTGPLEGELNLAEDGTFTYTPPAGFSGTATYTYTIQDGCEQTASSTLTITVGPPDCTFAVQIETTAANCGLNDGTATAIVDVPGEYTYNWSQGGIQNTISGLSSGPISVTVTDQSELCVVIATDLVPELEPAYIDAFSAVPGNCLGEGADILLTLSTPGSGPMTVVINNESSINVNEGDVSLATFTELLPGPYQLVVYDNSIGAACAETLLLNIPDNSEAPMAVADNFTTPFETALSGNVLNNDSGLNISLSEVDNVQGGTVTFTANGQFTFVPSPDFVGEGGFIYTLMDACGQTATASVTINVLPPACTFTVTINTTPADCGLSNGSAEAVVSEPGDYIYEWSTGASSTSVQFLPSGQIDLTVSTQDGLCQSFATGQVGSLPPSYVQSLNTVPGDCTGEGANILMEVTSPTGGPLQVDLGNGQLAQIPIGLVSLADHVPLTPGTYSLSVSDPAASGDTCVQSFTVEILDNTPALLVKPDFFTTNYQTPFSGNVHTNDEGLELSLINVSDIIGGLVTFTANGNFTFTPADGFVGEGSFSYTSTDACGQTATASVTINVLPPACTFTVTINTTPADCGLSNGSAEAVVSEPGDYIYEWSTGASSTNVQFLPSGQIDLTVSTQDGLCQSFATGQVGSLPPSYVQSLNTVPGDCTGAGADIIMEVTSPTGGPLQVDLSNGQLVQIPIGLVSLADHVPLTPGTYTLSVSDPAASGDTCFQSFTVEILDNTPDLLVKPDFFTTNYQTSINGNVHTNDEGLELSLINVSDIIGGLVTFTANGNFTFTPADGFVGEASFTYTSMDACGQTATASVTINVLPPACTFTVTINTTPTDCGLSNGSAEAVVSEPGEYTYSWSNGSTSNSINGVPAGSYTVTVTAFGGNCSQTATGQVTSLSVSYIESIETVPANCFGEGADVLLTTTTGAGSGPLTVIFNGETATDVPFGEVALSTWFDVAIGDFTLSLYDNSLGEECSETASGNIIENTPTPQLTNDEYSTPHGTVFSANVLDNDTGLELSLADVFDVVGGTVTFGTDGFFSFEPAEGFSGLAGFSYIATDACGQSASATVRIIVEASECTFSVAVSTSSAHCGMANGSASAEPDEPGTYTFVWFDGQVGQSITGLFAGNYDVTVTNEDNGCTVVTEFAIGDLPGPGIELLEANPPSGPSASDGSLVVEINPYTLPPFTILLNDLIWGSTEGEVFTIGDLPAGGYTVQVIDGAGCASNIIETFLSFTQQLVDWETLLGAPTVLRRSAPAAGVEHPASSLVHLGEGLGSQVTYQDRTNRYQLAIWSSASPNVNAQMMQLNWQKGISGNHWSLYNGLAAGYIRKSSIMNKTMDQGAFVYWATDLEWRPQQQASWSLDLHSAIGREEGWWWSGDLRLKWKW